MPIRSGNHNFDKNYKYLGERTLRAERLSSQENLSHWTDRDLTFLPSFAGLTTSQSFPQERIHGMISSREFRVKESPRLPPANCWICWLECQFSSRTSCAARPENRRTICSRSTFSLCQIWKLCRKRCSISGPAGFGFENFCAVRETRLIRASTKVRRALRFRYDYRDARPQIRPFPQSTWASAANYLAFFQLLHQDMTRVDESAPVFP